MPSKKLNLNNNTNTIFFAQYFKEMNKVAGGYGERVFGLYGTYAKEYSRENNEIYIFSEDGGTIYQCLKDKFVVIKKGCSLIDLFYFIFSKNNCKLILSWPNLKLSTIILCFICKIAKKYPLILDLHDLPLEQSLTFGFKVNNFKRFILQKYTKFTLLYADCLFSVSEAMREYIYNNYEIKKQKICIVPNGTLPELLYSGKKDVNQDGITICYSGSILRGKGVTELINLVNNLRVVRKNVKLELWGTNAMGIKSNDWLTVGSTSFSQMKNIFNKADVLIIPFPKNLYFDIAHPIKLSDYMAAGKPIVCLNLDTSGDIINKNQCGIVCNNYNEMYEALLKLNDNKQLRQKLGDNAYIAAKNIYDWRIIAQNMNKCIKDFFKYRLL